MIDPVYRTPKDLDRFRVGPLGPHIDTFAALVSEQGYSRKHGWHKIGLVGDLSRWLERRSLSLKLLGEQQITAFLETRWKRVSRRGDQATMTLLLRHLRESHVIPVLPPAAVHSDIDLIQREYEDFLLQERGLMQATRNNYHAVARRFLSHRFRGGKLRLNKLSVDDVTDFVLQETADRARHTNQLTATALRSFLNFLFQRGRTWTNLAAAVPAVARQRLSELPRFLEVKQVEKVLRCCDRRRKTGKRNYAILLLLARLGLRAGEAAYLTLDDIDWRTGQLSVHGKGARLDRLPLPEDVGQALVDYLQKGRPDCLSRRVFIRSQAPYQGLVGAASVCHIVQAALKRAQINSRYQGAHLLRHSLATRMLRSGASLAEIGQVLRHQLAQTTEIYAKVDLNALRTLALPWPGGVR